jgi:hypothetical protein
MGGSRWASMYVRGGSGGGLSAPCQHFGRTMPHRTPRLGRDTVPDPRSGEVGEGAVVSCFLV